MNILQLEQKLQNLTDNLSKDDFIFDFLSAYEMPKSSISRLRKNSDINTLASNGELSVKNKKLFFKITDAKTLDATYDELVKTKKDMRFLIVTDFVRFKASDAKLLTTLNITLDELSKNSDFFWALAGVEKASIYNEKEADVKASIKMAKLYEEIKKTNLTDTDEQKHALNVFLTRLLFCYYAEDTQIFGGDNAFTNYVKSITNEDGSDVDLHIANLFEVLNSKDRDISSHLKKFPFVNGGLFRDKTPLPKFTYKSRKLLLECGGELNWSQINPDIFGSMIQAVISDEHRGGNGMHYTSVPNIMKVINPLFLEELHEEFEKAKGNANKLNKLHKRITNIKIFDPACGSGNFLIIAYKELRRLEMQIFKSARMLNMPSIKLSQFYGIELDDFAHEVAILSLWLTEHQMNMEFTKEFGDCTPTLPLKDAGHIVQGNATRLEWSEVCPKEDWDEIYVLGNPPFEGARKQNPRQKEDMKIVFNGIKGFNNLDYVSCWFFIGAKYIKNINAKVAFVSTNSITQGKQVSLLWSNVLDDLVEINFAYKSFKWKNNAKDNAGVTVVIVGICNKTNNLKYLYHSDLKKEVKNINAYLIAGEDIFVTSRTNPLSIENIMQFGNMANDGGNFLLSDEEKNELVTKEPTSEKYIKKVLGSEEFLNDKNRWCLWLKNLDFNDLELMPSVKERIEKVKILRNGSSRQATKKLANTPHLFGEIRQSNNDYLIIPRVSSENRYYVPFGYISKDVIVTDRCAFIPNADLSLFGIMTSAMHMVWMRATCGRLETRYNYSIQLVYNNFPFPKITQTQKDTIEELVHLVLDERDKNFPKTMAELYDPNKMPEGLKQAHHNLDIYIESCYRDKAFENDEERLEYLFRLYEKMTKEEKK